MTKKSNEFLKLDKVYDATLKLGFISSTGDTEGQIRKYKQSIKSTKAEEHKGKICQRQILAAEGAKQCDKISDLSHCEASEVSGFYALGTIELAIKSFIGTIEQTPPRFSAIKINGQRAYKLARNGQDFEIPSRKVEIYSIDVLNYDYPNLTIRVHCSSGTYIRTLAEDIGKALHTGAYLTALRRIKIADYDIKDAKTLDEI